MEVLEMMCPHQSPHDKVLWELANKGKMTRSILCQHIGMKQVNLDIILADLEKDGRIIRIVGKHGELISLRE